MTRPVPSAETIRELRDNGWSWAGIAGIYRITEAAVRMLAGERISDPPPAQPPARKSYLSSG